MCVLHLFFCYNTYTPSSRICSAWPACRRHLQPDLRRQPRDADPQSAPSPVRVPRHQSRNPNCKSIFFKNIFKIDPSPFIKKDCPNFSRLIRFFKRFFFGKLHPNVTTSFKVNFSKMSNERGDFLKGFEGGAVESRKYPSN